MTVFLKENDNGVWFKIEHDYSYNLLCIEFKYYPDYCGASTSEVNLTFEQVREIYETMAEAANERNLKGL